MDRRAFIAGVVALSAAPHAAEAQSQPRLYRVGCLWPIPTPAPRARALQLPIRFSDVRNRDDIERVVRGLGQPAASAIFAMPDAFATFRYGGANPSKRLPGG